MRSRLSDGNRRHNVVTAEIHHRNPLRIRMGDVGKQTVRMNRNGVGKDASGMVQLPLLCSLMYLRWKSYSPLNLGCKLYGRSERLRGLAD
jgi:hypothetical protein